MIPNLIIILLTIIVAVLAYFFYKTYLQNEDLKTKYDKIIDIDSEVSRRTEKARSLDEDIGKLQSSFEEQKATLTAEYQKYKSVYDQLKAELATLEESLEMTSFGLYKPHYDYDTSERYKSELDARRERQKFLIKNEQAAICEIQWQVDGSVTKGKRQTKELIKLLLRAFNNECDAAMLKVKWNNAKQMEQRVIKAHEAINKLGTTQRTYITRDYLGLKLEELYLTHEYHVKRNEEQEEQKRIREQIREEERAQKEFEKAQKAAESEERRYATALEKARKEVQKAKGEELGSLNEQIAELERQLTEAKTQKERAISRAQLTKSGYVYVISNVGSFGENVYKIGMTRRMDPMDRVKELGDASVPFQFDVHAMIDSDNAPELEKRLHNHFASKRVNLVNMRKEFFNVSLDEIANEVNNNNGQIEFTLLAEAREFRETEALRKENEQSAQPVNAGGLPADLSSIN